ncbi:MAG TPA: hypothetical protein VLB50_04565 [Ignavibacteriaceae bacterium]|nr:hypothetical protein [Ignavibacteriaceae bacterium]
MKTSLIVTAILLFCLQESYSQTVNIGLTTDIILTCKNSPENNIKGSYISIPPFNAYLKAGIQYDIFGIDFKGGLLLGNPFFGGEYGANLKIKTTEKISYLIAWLRHLNGRGDGNSGGNYVEPINFIGLGAETKLTRLFGVNLILYFPVGNNKLEFLRDFSDPDNLIVSSRVGPMIRLGFIFDIIRFN